MNILITRAKGMIGIALVANFKNIKDNKNHTCPKLLIDEIYEFDLDSRPDELDEYLLQAVNTAIQLNKEGDYGTPVPDCIDENVSTKVIKIIQSYTGVVNKMIWRK